MYASHERIDKYYILLQFSYTGIHVFLGHGLGANDKYTSIKIVLLTNFNISWATLLLTTADVQPFSKGYTALDNRQLFLSFLLIIYRQRKNQTSKTKLGLVNKYFQSRAVPPLTSLIIVGVAY